MTEKLKTGRVSRCTPENTERAAKVLRETGQDKFAYKAIGISKTLFYRWKKEHPDFGAAMDQARKDFDEGTFEAASAEIAQARAWLLKCLANEQFQIIRIKKKNPQGELEVVEIKEVQVLPPSWYLERLFAGSEEKKELTVKIGIAKPIDRTDKEIEVDMAGYDDEQDDYGHFDELEE